MRRLMRHGFSPILTRLAVDQAVRRKQADSDVVVLCTGNIVEVQTHRSHSFVQYGNSCIDLCVD